MYSDGGPDHNITFPAVQLSLYALFKLQNVDMLIAARCCPGKSYTNPAEKVHCVMNLGLQTAALERSLMTPPYEQKLKKHSNMTDIRSACDKDEGLASALLGSVKPCHEAIAEVFQRLSLKGEKFKIHQPATQDQLGAAWSVLTQIEPKLKQVNILYNGWPI